MIPFPTILLHPALPWPVLTAAALFFAVLAWLTYRKCQLPRRTRWTLWGLRMGALAIMVWLVLLPVNRTTQTLREPSILAVAVDVSASMKDAAANGEARADRVRAFLGGSDFKRRAGDLRTVFFEIGGEAVEREGFPSDPRFDAPRSNITSSLNEIASRLSEEDVASVILLSDGLDHSAESLSAEVKALPIYAIELEDPESESRQPRYDFFIGELAYPERAVAGWDARIDVLVRRRHQGDETCRVHLYREDTRISTQVTPFAGRDAFQRVSFDIHPEHPGDIYFYVEIETGGKDVRPHNNQREFMIRAVASENRVLYLEGVPRWEFKFFKRALLEEAAFKVSAYVRGAKGDFVSFAEEQGFARMSLPELTTDELLNYRAVVLGNLRLTALDQVAFNNIADFVEKGGGLLLIGGAAAYGPEGLTQDDQMASLLPAKPEADGRMEDGRFHVELTPAARAHPAFQALTDYGALPPVLSVWKPSATREFASTLIAAADGTPVVSIRRFGEGRVAMILSDSMWRWQLSGGSIGEKSHYNRFMTQLVHWLSPADRQTIEKNLLQIVMSETEYELRREVVVGATYGAGEPPGQQLSCDIVTPAGRRLTMPMQRTELGREVGRDTPIPGFTTRFTPDIPGRYRVQVTDPAGTDRAETRFLVKRPARELSGAPANHELLRNITDETGGRYVTWKDRAGFLDEIPNRIREIKVAEETPLWNRLPWFLALVIIFTAEWWLRRKHNLV